MKMQARYNYDEFCFMIKKKRVDYSSQIITEKLFIKIKL
jgi:hypothetical protein